MISVHHTLHSWTLIRDELLASEKSIGFVPTMGALHDGHLSLIRKAKKENDTVLVSIFVNPTQFDNADDLKKYPSTIDQDLILAESAGGTHLILPDKNQMYPDNYRYRMAESDFSKKLCGAHRPGHFDGVLTVVLKLLNIAKSTRAYFGEKDYQQFELIRQMCNAMFMDTEVIPCPTLRAADGLALSSRNLRLSTDERIMAPHFPKTLAKSLIGKQSTSEARSQLEKLGFRVDYVEDMHFESNPTRRFGAVFLGDVRLIDNMTESTAAVILREIK